MKQIFTVFKFTYLDACRKKVFIITTLVLIALVVLVCMIPAIIGIFDNNDVGDGDIDINPDTSLPPDIEDGAVVEPPEENSMLCYYFDENDLIKGGADALKAFLFDTDIVSLESSNDIDGIKELIKEDASVFFVEIKDMDGIPFVNIVTKDFMTEVSPSYIAEILEVVYKENILSEMGVSEEAMSIMNVTLPYSSESVGMLDLTSYIVGIFATLIIFFAVYYYGYGVAMSVATEKATRVMETLIVSAKPSRILIGKCLAMGALGLTQLSAVIFSAIISFILFVPKDFTVLGSPISLGSIKPEALLLLLIYFILGYALYAFLNSVCGASVSKIEDLNSAMMPVMFIALISFYIGYFSALSSPEGGILQMIAMYVPFTSPFLMPYKLLTSEVLLTETLISIALLVVAIAIVAFVSIKIYSASVLHYGNKLKFKDAYKTKL